MPALTFEEILKSKPNKDPAPVSTEADNAFSIYKTDDDKRLVFGWASVSIKLDGEQLKDRQEDMIDPDDLEEAAYEYVLNFRDTGEEHISTMRKKGKLVESCVFTAEKQKAMGIPEGILPIAWWIGFKIEDDAAWERVKNGTYRMFSIEGKANRLPVEKSHEPTGCGVLVVQNGKVLTGTRIERASRGQICGPGGHIEAGESPEEAAKREAYEEFGITCNDLTPLGVQDGGSKHGSSAIFMCSSFSGTPKTDETEMTDVKWLAPGEIEEAGTFPPFWQSLKLLPVEKSVETVEKAQPNYDEFPSFDMWLEENLDATIEEQREAIEHYRKHRKVAKTFDEILKFNQNHDSLGRFASGSSGGGAVQTRTAPSLKSAKDFDDYVEKNGLKPIYRGYSADTPEHLDDYEESIKSGTSTTSGDRTSALGKGVYFADNATEAEGYMNRRKDENGDKYGRVTTAALDVGAKIGDYREFEHKKFEAEADLNAKAIKTFSNGGTFEEARKIADKAMEIRRMSVAEYAATQGYDAIYDKTTGYTVVSNQNALVVKVENTAKSDSVGKTFDEILKFNPFHDARGRFASSNGFATYSANPKSKAGAMAISRSAQAGHGTTFNSHRESQGENINQNYAWLNGGPGAKQLGAQGQLAAQQPKTPPKPTKNYDARGFADHDDADFHQLYNGRQYYSQQKLTAKEQKAASNYLEDRPEPGSLYSHSQNMNYQMVNGQKLTGKYKQTHDGMMSAMHNIGYNVELTRYDHPDMVNGLLKTIGAGTNYERMSQASLKKALVGQTVSENKFLSTSYNNFKNAPQSTKSIFDSRAVKVNYKVKADTQGMMPGKGNGGDFGEIVLAPTNGTTNRAGRITDVRLTGQMVRRKGTQMYNQPRIEIDIEI